MNVKPLLCVTDLPEEFPWYNRVGEKHPYSIDALTVKCTLVQARRTPDGLIAHNKVSLSRVEQEHFYFPKINWSDQTAIQRIIWKRARKSGFLLYRKSCMRTGRMSGTRRSRRLLRSAEGFLYLMS